MAKRWTPNDDATLRRLWPKNSSEVIANRLGRPRNSICGRAHRLGLKKDGSPDELPTVKHTTKRTYNTSKHQSKAARRMLNLPVNPSTFGTLLTDLESRDCRWPMWADGEAPNMRFCGKSSYVGSYCAEHSIRAFNGTAVASKRLVRSCSRH